MSLRNLLESAKQNNASDFERIFEEVLDEKVQFVLENKYSDMYGLPTLEEQVESLMEKLIVFNGGAKYGQIVFMSGGAGSGKGFAGSTFMESEKFKVRDVDEWKKAFLKISELKNKYPEIRGLNLKNSKDVFKLHQFVKDLSVNNKSFKEGTLDLLLKDIRADRLPNIMFDITAKDLDDITEVLPVLQEAGYDAKNIHLAWILTDFKVSYAANLTRERVVPADIFLDTHRGASKTMQGILNRGSLPRGMDGRFVVVLNNRENTIFFKAGEKYKGKTVPETARGVKDFYYIEVKRAGKPFKPDADWKKELHAQIVQNVPGGQDSLDSLRADALERLAPKAAKGDKDAEEGIDIVKGDIEKDRKLKKALETINKRTGKSYKFEDFSKKGVIPKDIKTAVMRLAQQY